MRSIYSTLFLLLLNIFYCSAQLSENNKAIALIPYPQLVITEKDSLAIKNFSITYYCSDSNVFGNEINYLKETLFKYNSLQLTDAGKATIQLIKNDALAEDAYRLNINETGIKLEAKTSEGMFYGLQTLRQMMALSGNTKTFTLPYIKIEDAPAYEWRGVELDVARHFYSKEFLFKFIDLLSLYKFNKLHLHLTDDQGWRLDIKRYPKLVIQGGWRTFNNQDSACIEKSKDNPDFALPVEYIRIAGVSPNEIKEYGGYYTQDDMREIIAYADKRHIEIIPEIDMPGHMMVAAKAYPELLDGSLAAGVNYFQCHCVYARKKLLSLLKMY